MPWHSRRARGGQDERGRPLRRRKWHQALLRDPGNRPPAHPAADGGRIKGPLTEQPGGAQVGYVMDKFGINWVVSIEKA